MITTLTRSIIGISLCGFLFLGTSLATEPVEIGNFIKSRIEIGEMMTSFFKGGKGYGDGQRPSPEAMREMGMDINRKVSALLATHDLTIEKYRQHSPEVFADDAAVQAYLNEHPDLQKRYEALPLDRMGHSGGRRGYKTGKD